MNSLRSEILYLTREEFATFLFDSHYDLYEKWSGMLHSITSRKIDYLLRSDVRGVFISSAFRRIEYSVTVRVENAALRAMEVNSTTICV